VYRPTPARFARLLADILPDPDQKMAQVLVVAALAGIRLQ